MMGEHRKSGSFHIPLPHPHQSNHHKHHDSTTSNASDASTTSSKPDTPHPTVAHAKTFGGPVSYLDSHSSHFRHVHSEYTVNHDFKAAKKAARNTKDTQIPELSEDPEDFMTEEERLEQRKRDRAEWDRIMAAREAARRRNTFSSNEDAEALERTGTENAVSE